MATNFPASLDTLTNPTANDKVDVVSHADQHANANDAIEALQAKVGANGSAVQTSHDFKLSEVTGPAKAVSTTAIQTLENKTLTAPDINNPDIDGGTIDGVTLGSATMALGSDAEGDIYYRNAAGALTRLARGAVGRVLTMVGNLPSWQPVPASGVTVEAATGTSYSLTTTGSERVVVWVKGTIVRTTAQTAQATISVTYDSVTKDSVTQLPENDSNARRENFALMYTEVPTAGTRTIAVSTSVGTLENVSIIVQKIV